MKLVGCQTESSMLSCQTCSMNGFPYFCNVFRDEHNMEKILTWEFVQTPESSNIEMFAYEERVLRVCFKNGTIYDYREVPENVFADMVKTDSKGKFLNANLKGKYQAVKVE